MGSSKERTETLLERVAKGEGAAVPLLIDAFGPLVWSIVRKQVEAATAEDVVQEVFIQIWKSAERYDPERASEATFITTIARRRVVDHHRKLGRRPAIEELVEEEPVADEGLEGVDLGDEARIALEALAELKPDQRRVLKLAIVEGLTHTEISSVTGLPLGTVKSHARRGLERVRALLEERNAARGQSS